jgi:signal transduction histidine kinase
MLPATEGAEIIRRIRLSAASRLCGQLASAISSPRGRRGRLAAEIGLALVVGAAAFVLAAAAGAVARSRTPELLGLFLVMAVGVGGFTTHARRRVAGSEEARGALADEQEALRRVATLVARQPSPAEVFAAVTEEAGKLLHLDTAHLLVYEGDGTATAAGAWGLRAAQLPVGTRFPLEGDNIAVRVLRTQWPVRIDDYASPDPATGGARLAGVRAAVGTPITVGGRLWGVMAIGSARPEPLPAGIEVRLGAFTDLVATAIANAQAREELELLAAEQAALRRVATLVAEAAPPGDVFTAVTAEVAALFDVPLVGLNRYETDRATMVVAGANKGSSYLGRRWSFAADDQSIMASLLRTGRPFRIDDYVVLDEAEEADVGAIAGVPVIVGGRVWGSVTLAAGHDRLPLPADTLDRLAAFTELVATAIANTEARSEIERLAQEQAALRRVATLVARGTPPEEVMAAVAEEIGRVLKAEVASVARFEADATGTVVTTWGDASFWPVGSNWPLEGVAARVYRTRRPARMDGYEGAPGEITDMARRIGGRSRVGAPVIIGDRLWGAALALNFASGGALPDAAEERMANFADLITTAISNAETRTELTASRARVVTAADDTRRRLERDLHDGIQQRLVSLALNARTIARSAPRPAGVIQGELSLLADGLGATLDELREISHGIHPAILSEAGLGPALKTLARRSAVPVVLELNLGSLLDEHLEAAAYYVASEALTNAAKHARASVVDIRVDDRGGGLTLVVRDDGIGGADPRRGSGIIGLKDRVEALGGTVSLLSPPGRGTTLHVEFPAQRGN